MIVWLLIGANAVFSWMGFNDRDLFEKYLFRAGSIIHYREYIRLISSAFLHVDYLHLALNMYVFWSFSFSLQHFFTDYGLLNIYAGSLLAGNLLALYIHRHHEDYRAVGASGAVSGIVYASIVLMPQNKLTIILFPFFSFPAWLFGVGYIIYTILGIRNQRGNIGHEAHLGGAIGGLVIALLYYPILLKTQAWIVAAMLVPTIAFLFIIARYPAFLITGKLPFGNGSTAGKQAKMRSMYRDTENYDRAELNRILDKINEKGVNSLTADEKSFLDRYQ